jgi:hypothetical protein
MSHRWNSNNREGNKLRELFNNEQVDLNNIKSDYLKTIKDAYPAEFGQFTNSVFYSHYRKLLQSFKVGKALKGARDSKCSFGLCTLLVDLYKPDMISLLYQRPIISSL